MSYDSYTLEPLASVRVTRQSLYHAGDTHRSRVKDDSEKHSI